MDHACARTCVRRLVYGRHISARDAQFMSVCDRSKKSSGKTSVEGKNGRIDFSSLVWDKGIALSGITSESLKVHSCSPMSLHFKGLGKPAHIK